MEFKFFKTVFTGFILASSCLVNIANAGIIEYTDESIFLNNTNTDLLEGFESTATGDYGFSNNFTLTDFDLAVTSSTISMNVGSFCCGTPTEGVNALQVWANASLGFNFDVSQSAFGFSFIDIDASSFDVNYTLSNGQQQTLSYTGRPSGNGSVNFFGLSSDVAFTSVSVLFTSGSAIGIDSIRYNSTASVPEPSTLAIFALGMMGLASRRFKKQS